MICWRWTNTGRFTVHSLYKWIEYGDIPNHTYDQTWTAKIPLKIEVFVWLVRQNKVLTKHNLLKKDWLEDPSCPFCGQLETTNHLFVTCPLISSI